MGDADYTRDRDLVARALAGDEEALSAIAVTVTDLTALALRKLRSRGARLLDPENLAAEVRFLVLVRDRQKTLGHYQGKSALRTFLWQIVKYKTIDLMRGQQKNPHALALEDAAEPGVERPHERHWDITRALFEYLARQEPQVRLVLEARWLDELSYREIAEKAGRELQRDVSRESIGTILFQHRKKFEERLRKLGLLSD